MLDLGDLVAEEKNDFRIFVADIEISVGRLNDPGGDQHAFDKAMRIALKIVPILECAGLALVAIDGEQPRRRLGADQRPFPAGRKAGAAEAAQAGVADDFDKIVAGAFTGKAGFEQFVAAALYVYVKGSRRRIGVRMRRLRRGRGNFRRVRLHDSAMADRADRRTVAGSHAWRPYHADIGA